MDPLYQMAHPKSHQTHTSVCGMMTQHDYWQLADDWTREEMARNPKWAATDTELPMNNITCLAGGEEMLRVGPDGFWVRGKRVEQDDKEAETVYNAFKAWMTWATLNKDYK